jgi:chromosome segregation ATPase
MKTRWYFIIAGAAVAGFAVWYQDYERVDSARRATVAAEAVRERAAEIKRRQDEHDAAIAQARKELEVRAAERAKLAREAVAAQALREERQSQLAATREETAALRVSRDRLAREIDELETRIAAQTREVASIAAEDAFLRDYIDEATASVARLQAVAERAVHHRFATATPQMTPSTR